MKNLIKRIHAHLLERYLRKFPVVVVLGARQVGKTTLARKLIRGKRKFITFDDEGMIMTARDDLRAFVGQKGRLTIDEVQKLPEILSAIKMDVDEARVPGRFLLTGSANLLMLPKIRESLAGRAAYLEIEPLTIFESRGGIGSAPRLIKMLNAPNGWKALNSFDHKEMPLEKYIFKGGYPDVWLEKNTARIGDWFKNYIKTYLERDIRDLSNIHNLYEFRKFLSLLALRCGQILNKADLARDAGIPYTTAAQFFNLLLASFQVIAVEPYFRNIGKRLIKAPKLMWSDTGVAAYLQGLNSWGDAQRLGRVGFLLENKMFIEFKTILSVFKPAAKIFYWRTSAGAEIDMLIEDRGKLFPIEIKWSDKVDRHDLNSLKIFMKDFKKEAPWGMVLYRGKALIKAADNIFLVPFGRLI